MGRRSGRPCTSAALIGTSFAPSPIMGLPLAPETVEPAAGFLMLRSTKVWYGALSQRGAGMTQNRDLRLSSAQARATINRNIFGFSPATILLGGQHNPT